MNIKQTKEHQEVEEAIGFLVDCIRKKCRNKKPLMLHSLRVGIKLMELNQPKEVIFYPF